MDFVTKAITIKTIDLRENDKIVKLFTPNGIISAQAKGIKKANAKLKFCAQPFCFFEAVLHKKDDFNTLMGGMLIDSFFDLSQDYDRYIAACCVLESLDAFAPTGCNSAFVLVLKTFSAFLAARPKEILIKYFCEALRITGYQYTYAKCAACGKSINGGKLWFDFDTGVLCDLCKSNEAVPLSLGAQSAIRIIEDSDIQKIATLKLNDAALNEALTLMGLIYKEKNNILLKSLKSLINA